MNVQIRYTLSGGELKIEYAAMSDKKTVINMTNHAYFNLDGEGSGDVLNTIVRINADKITPTDETLIPHGAFRDVTGTPFDFRDGKKIGQDIDNTEDADIRVGNGYDVNYLLNKRTGEYAKVAEAESEKTGIVMEVFTNMPAMQFYTGNGLNQNGKTGHYGSRAGFCMETQFIPNAVNCPSYAVHGDPVFDKNKIYHYATAYKFSRK